MSEIKKFFSKYNKTQKDINEAIKVFDDILKIKEPVSIYTCILEHNVYLCEEFPELTYEEIEDQDTIVIHTQNKTKKDISGFFEKIKSNKLMQKSLKSGRSYFFEGIKKEDDTHYIICWGS